MPDKTKSLRKTAFRRLYYYIRIMSGDITVMRCFFDAIAEKKCAYIREATTKSEMEEILKPCISNYDGMKFCEEKYHVHEEEIIFLSATSLEAPLKAVYCDRMMELLKMLMPNEYEECFGNKKAS